uniref:Ig-like domain-containing protein n=1 Tax=Amphiprion ocellaris TaxID=80972 RepID=A0A3Q1B609_AMPOC
HAHIWLHLTPVFGLLLTSEQYQTSKVIYFCLLFSHPETLENYTIKTTDHKGLFTVESMLGILGNLSNRTFFCSFISADKTQVWTASRKNQEDITQEEGHALSIPCIAPHSLQNFSLTWTFASSTEPTVILRYDNRTRHTFNLWEGQAELDQDLLLMGDGSLLLHKPDREEHSGTYICTFSGLQSRHVVQTKVNVTVTRAASHRYNGTGLVEDGLHKDLNIAASYMMGQHGDQCNRQPAQFEAQDEAAGCVPKTAEDFSATLPPDTEIDQEETAVEPPVEGNDGLQSSSLETDGFENTEPGIYAP